MKTLNDHLHQDPTNPEPKRILALDGGGIRGALTLGLLKHLEDVLKERHGNDPGFRLCHYFDLIGGTSTGSIIATLLAIGRTVDEIQEMYQRLGSQVFGDQRIFSLFRAGKFDEKSLQKLLVEELGADTTLGSDKILTGLCIVAKRADTGGTWAIMNHPGGKYFPQNKGFLLHKAVRASTAAPTYFVAEKIDVGNGEIGAFVDGGVSMHNNPAMLMFLVATLDGFPFHWQAGEDKLMVVSIGTGYNKIKHQLKEVTDIISVQWAPIVPELLMYDADMYNQLMLQYLSKSPMPRVIDSEIGDLRNDLLTSKAALHYLRYDVHLEQNELNALGFPNIVAESLREMSQASNKEILRDLGLKAGLRDVKPEHFPKIFDL